MIFVIPTQSQMHLRCYCWSSTTQLTLCSSRLLWFSHCSRPHFLTKDALFNGSESNHPTSPTGNHTFFDGQHAQPLVHWSILTCKLLGSQEHLVSQCVHRCQDVGRLLTETSKTRSSLGCGTWPHLMCCALVSVWVPEVGGGRVGASEQRDSSDSDQDSEWRGGIKYRRVIEGYLYEGENCRNTRGTRSPGSVLELQMCWVAQILPQRNLRSEDLKGVNISTRM